MYSGIGLATPNTQNIDTRRCRVRTHNVRNKLTRLLLKEDWCWPRCVRLVCGVIVWQAVLLHEWIMFCDWFMALGREVSCDMFIVASLIVYVTICHVNLLLSLKCCFMLCVRISESIWWEFLQMLHVRGSTQWLRIIRWIVDMDYKQTTQTLPVIGCFVIIFQSNCPQTRFE